MSSLSASPAVQSLPEIQPLHHQTLEANTERGVVHLKTFLSKTTFISPSNALSPCSSKLQSRRSRYLTKKAPSTLNLGITADAK